MEFTRQIIDNDFMMLKELAIFGKSDNAQYFGSYDCIYPFTNDRLKDIYKKIDCSKGVLTVTGSGDQALMAILNGASKIKMFDINHLAKYFVLFKFAAIRCLSYDEFIKLYKVNVPFSNLIAGGFLSNVDVNLYEKVCSNMELLPSRFFELLYDFFETATESEKFNIINAKHYPKLSGYLNREDYEKLRQKLKTINKIEYIDCHIFDIKKYLGNEKYSSMVFSNISTYFNKAELNYFLTLLKELKNNLTKDALLQVGYGNVKPSSEIGRNRMNVNFVDSNRACFYETISHGKVITFYKPNNN